MFCLVLLLQAFDEGDPKADENIRSIESGTQLLDAVKACVNAVRHFYNNLFCSQMREMEPDDHGVIVRSSVGAGPIGVG